MKKILPLLLLTPTLANAECTPAPDCASIGYTQTSCETISLKCPFDQSKLYCFPCDSSYQYLCSEPNEYGDGESCNNKYKSCCNTDCVVGAIYYSDKTCSSCVDNNKTPIGVVVKDNELIIALEKTSIAWSPSWIDIADINNFTFATARNDMNGQANTQAIVDQYGEDADPNQYAGIYCYQYAPPSAENTKGKWYLASAGEMENYVSMNYSKIRATWNKLNVVKSLDWVWTSTERETSSAWCDLVLETSETILWDEKTYQKHTICLMNIRS